jgi:diphthamide synthase (EF-2-diphthine--ammonia ligase)
MGTKAETIRVAARPPGFTLWTAAVSALAAAALIMSAVALTLAAGDRAVTGVTGGGIHEAASTGSLLWDADKLAAMQGRVLAESVRIDGYAPLWDTGKLEAMEGRMLAEIVRIDGYAPLWDADKLEAMEGRVRAG